MMLEHYLRFTVLLTTPAAERLNALATEVNVCHQELLIALAGGVKGKAIPLQAWTGSEGSRRLRLPDFKTIGA
jgi:hypothetical protein